MKKLSLSVVAVLAATALAVALSSGSSHNEAPNSSLQPDDWTDLYFFTPPNNPDNAVVVGNAGPFQDPADGPLFAGALDPNARYYINFDNTGDGKYDIRYRFVVEDHIDKQTRLALGASGPVTSVDDPDLLLRQTYDVTRLDYNRRGRVTDRSKVGNDLPVAPANFGPKTMPDYQAIVNQSIGSLKGGGNVFVGRRDDPFFIDLGVTFDLIDFRADTGTGNQGGGKDDVAGYDVSSFVLELPDAALKGKASSAVGAWVSTERRKLEVTNGRDRGGKGPWVQVNRLGNPLINELFIPISRKDEFNRTQPSQDGKRFGQYALEPELVKAINGLFNLGCPERNRTDIVEALFTGIPGVTAIGSNPTPADTLKLNLDVPPTDPAQVSRFGVIGGDNAGLPNGRRLFDDAVDIYLRVACGFLVPEDQGGMKLPLGDGVDVNDKEFLSSFPYVAAPTSGFDSQIKKNQPSHEPTSGTPPLLP